MNQSRLGWLVGVVVLVPVVGLATSNAVTDRWDGGEPGVVLTPVPGAPSATAGEASARPGSPTAVAPTPVRATASRVSPRPTRAPATRATSTQPQPTGTGSPRRSGGSSGGDPGGGRGGR